MPQKQPISTFESLAGEFELAGGRIKDVLVRRVGARDTELRIIDSIAWISERSEA